MFESGKSKLLSVIVPVYNVEEYLEKCLKSIINQTYKHFEVILVDDGSQDKSGDICDKYVRSYSSFKVIHQNNQGLVAARKAGLNIAKGEYIAFLDSDDWIEPKMYEEMVNEIIMTGADMAESGMLYEKKGSVERKDEIEDAFFEMNDKIKRKFLVSCLLEDKEFLVLHNLVNKVFKKELIMDSYNSVPNEMSHGEDFICYLYCLMKARKIKRIANEYYHYIYREDSIVHNGSVNRLGNEIKMLEHIKHIILQMNLGISSDFMDKYLISKIMKKASLLFNEKMGLSEKRTNYYYFPAMNEILGKKIIIYGAGNIGRDYVSQFSKYESCTIVAWIDRNYDKLVSPEYRKIEGIKKLMEVDFDIIVIAIANEETANKIRDDLKDLKISSDIIIWDKPRVIADALLDI